MPTQLEEPQREASKAFTLGQTELLKARKAAGEVRGEVRARDPEAPRPGREPVATLWPFAASPHVILINKLERGINAMFGQHPEVDVEVNEGEGVDLLANVEGDRVDGVREPGEARVRQGTLYHILYCTRVYTFILI